MKEPDTKYKGKILYFYIAEQKNPSHVILEAKTWGVKCNVWDKKFQFRKF